MKWIQSSTVRIGYKIEKIRESNRLYLGFNSTYKVFKIFYFFLFILFIYLFFFFTCRWRQTFQRSALASYQPVHRRTWAQEDRTPAATPRKEATHDHAHAEVKTHIRKVTTGQRKKIE